MTFEGVYPEKISHAASQTSADFDQLTTPARLAVSPPLHLSIHLANPAFRLCRKLNVAVSNGPRRRKAGSDYRRWRGCGCFVIT